MEIIPMEASRAALTQRKGAVIAAALNAPGPAGTRKRSIRSVRAEAAFRARVRELGGEVLDSEWKGARKGHRVRCALGHEHSPQPSDVQQGAGICRTCAGNDPKAAEAAFRRRVAELGGEVLEPTWLGKGRPHRVRCAAGHLASPRPNGVQQGGGLCGICAGNNSKNAEVAFRNRVEALGGTVLEPVWLGRDRGHRVRCAGGHVGTPRPTHVQQGKGICRACAGRDPKAAEAAFRLRVKELGGVVLESAWLGKNKGHRVRCALGHETTSRPSSVQQGGGFCRFCAGRTWDVFYVIANDEERIVKFGITSGDPRPRLRWHASNGFVRVIRLVKGLPNDTAPQLESAIIKALRDAREAPARGREYYPARSLGLILDLVDGWTTGANDDPPQPCIQSL